MRTRSKVLLASLVAGSSLVGVMTLRPPSAALAEPSAALYDPKTVTLEFERFTLPNGLEVVLHADHRTPIVAVNVWYHVGSKDEPAGKNGFAHLFEHLMFQGSKNVGEDMFFKYLDRAGASAHNGSTNLDRTNYFETLPSNELELALWLESDRMGTLLDHVDQKTFESQREVVKNERRQNYENAPYGWVRQLIATALYPEKHPYRLLTIGTPNDLDAATLDDVRAFFKTYYVPNNASLVIAGDIDVATTKALVEAYFGPIPRGAAPPTVTKPSAVTLAAETRLEVEAGVELPRLVLTWPTPERFAKGDAELDVVANVLAGGSRSARLYKKLVYDLDLAQDVSAGQSSNMLNGVFEITVTLKKDKKPEDALKLVDAELAALRATAPTSDEMERTNTRIASGEIFGLETMTARGDTMNSYIHYAHDPGFLARDLARYTSLSADDVKSAAITWLPADKRIVTFVRPVKGAPRSGQLKGAAEPAKGAK